MKLWILDWQWGDYEDLSYETVGVFSSEEKAKAAVPVSILRWAANRFALYEPDRDWSEFDGSYIIGLDASGGEWQIFPVELDAAEFSYMHYYRDIGSTG